MKKYFIRFNSSMGALAIEKHMHVYISKTYADVLVSEEAIETVVSDLQKQIEDYLKAHKTAKPITVSKSINRCTDGYFISVGSLVLCLSFVKRKIL